MRRFLLILVIISISQLGCESSLNSDNTNADEPTNASEVGDDTLTYSKVADLYNGAELYYGNYTIKIENDSISEIICSNLCSYPELSPDKKELRIFTLMSRTVLEHCISIMLKMIVKIF